MFQTVCAKQLLIELKTPWARARTSRLFSWAAASPATAALRRRAGVRPGKPWQPLHSQARRRRVGKAACCCWACSTQVCGGGGGGGGGGKCYKSTTCESSADVPDDRRLPTVLSTCTVTVPVLRSLSLRRCLRHAGRASAARSSSVTIRRSASRRSLPSASAMASITSSGSRSSSAPASPASPLPVAAASAGRGDGSAGRCRLRRSLTAAAAFALASCSVLRCLAAAYKWECAQKRKLACLG